MSSVTQPTPQGVHRATISWPLWNGFPLKEASPSVSQMMLFPVCWEGTTGSRAPVSGFGHSCSANLRPLREGAEGGWEPQPDKTAHFLMGPNYRNSCVWDSVHGREAPASGILQNPQDCGCSQEAWGSDQLFGVGEAGSSHPTPVPKHTPVLHFGENTVGFCRTAQSCWTSVSAP